MKSFGDNSTLFYIHLEAAGWVLFGGSKLELTSLSFGKDFSAPPHNANRLDTAAKTPEQP